MHNFGSVYIGAEAWRNGIDPFLCMGLPGCRTRRALRIREDAATQLSPPPCSASGAARLETSWLSSAASSPGSRVWVGDLDAAGLLLLLELEAPWFTIKTSTKSKRIIAEELITITQN